MNKLPAVINNYKIKIQSYQILILNRESCFTGMVEKDILYII